MTLKVPAAALFAIFLVVAFAGAAPVDLNTWVAESYPAVSGFGPGVWTVGGGGSSVFQSVNGQPTIFYSDFNAFNTDVTGRIQVSAGAGDDDYIGFVLGFNGGDSSNGAADYLLVDWKQEEQFFDFGNPSTTPGSTAFEGLAVSRVSGTPFADEFWGHVDLPGNPTGGLNELQRGANLGSTGWVHGTEYEFRFVFTPTTLQVFVDGVQEISINGAFSDGRLGFYNFSQASVTYSAFTVDPAPTPTPEPGTLLLLGFGAAGALGMARRR
ncbi:MAG: PEP-CTERM sorting domain-containing protein, partial [Vicinamibacteria bacterium]